MISLLRHPITWLILICLGQSVALMFQHERHLSEVAALQKSLAKAELSTRSMEHQFADQQNQIVTTYEEKLHALQMVNDAAQRSVNGLRVSHNTTSSLSSSRPSTDRTDGPRSVRFSEQDAHFLLDEAHRADTLAARVTALQQLIVEDRKICNGK